MERVKHKSLIYTVHVKKRHQMKMMLLKACLFLAGVGVAVALDNGLALTPPMGFIPCDRFGCNLDCKNDPDDCMSEKLFRAMADVFVSEGYRDLGYTYVNVDDCWSTKSRDSQGKLVPNPELFPSGMRNLSDYMHARGLKLGIYLDVGTETCKRFPGSQNHLKQDAQSLAEWGVDLLKMDGCHSTWKHMAQYYPEMSLHLNETGRPILFSCEWAAYDILNTQEMYLRNKKYCNTWRNFFDIRDKWLNILSTIEYFTWNIGNFSGVAGPGGFNDPDQLVVGDFSLSYDQEKVQFGMWAMFAAPLYISADLRTMRPQAKSILQNKGVIAISQDPLGRGAHYVKKLGDIQVYLKQLVHPGTFAIALFLPESGPAPTMASLTLSELKLTNPNGYNITDVFEDVHIGTYKYTDTIKIAVNPTGIVILRANPVWGNSL